MFKWIKQVFFFSYAPNYLWLIVAAIRNILNINISDEIIEISKRIAKSYYDICVGDNGWICVNTLKNRTCEKCNACIHIANKLRDKQSYIFSKWNNSSLQYITQTRFIQCKDARKSPQANVSMCAILDSARKRLRNEYP